MTDPLGPLTTPKVLGADVELGNFIHGVDSSVGTGALAARYLLNEIAGVPSHASFGADWGSYAVAAYQSGPGGWHTAAADVDPQDRGRRFLQENGGCAYIDLDHLELALPETRSAFDHVAHWRAMLSLARGARTTANRSLTDGRRIQVLVNNSDGLGQSYGSHMNVMLSRAAWDNIMHRRPHYLAFLSAFQVSSIVFTGQGKVGSENGRPHADYQLSQRADFMETIVSLQTTINRPIVNSRDEPLCGPEVRLRRAPDDPDLARLHVIFFDSTLCDTASLLRAGTMQIVVAMLEARCVDPLLVLDDPLDALHAWSADPTLRTRARTASGARLTAVEIQGRFLVAAQAFVQSGGCEGVVPRASEILALWEDTLSKLGDRDFPALSRRLDWVLKLQMLRRAMAQRPGLTWNSPQMKHLDQMYASLDETDGLFWAYERAGLVDRVVDDQHVAWAASNPPEDTRAWTRAHLMRCAGAAHIERMDWDVMTVRVPSYAGDRRWMRTRTIRLPRPDQATRADHQHVFHPDRSLEDVVEALRPADEYSVY